MCVVYVISSSYEMFELIKQECETHSLEIRVQHQRTLNNIVTAPTTEASDLIILHEENTDTSAYLSFVEQNHSKPIIVITDFPSMERAVLFMKSGAFSVIHSRNIPQIIEELTALFAKPKTENVKNFEIFLKLIESVDYIAVQGYNKKGEVVYWSPGSEKLYGYLRSEAIGRRLDELIIPSNIKENPVSELSRIIENDIQSPVRELSLINKKGQKVNILTKYLTFDKEFIYFIDINFSLQNEVQKRLELERTYFETLFEYSPLAICVLDNDDRFISCNHQFEVLFGYSRNEIKGLRINDLIVPEHLRIEGEELTKKVAQSQSVYKETVRKNRFGNLIDVAIIGKPVMLEGNQISVLGIYQDISTRKEAERALIKAKQQAEANDRLKTTFLNNISHEVRTPLNGIIGFVNLLMAQNPDEKTKQNYYKIILDSCDRLLTTITNYIDASLLLSNNVTVNIAPIEPKKIILDLHSEYYDKIAAKNIDFIIQLPEATGLSAQIAPNTYADRELKEFPSKGSNKVASENKHNTLRLRTDEEIVKKIIAHLLDNAIKFTTKGKITLGLEIHDRQVCLFVEDTGIGIPKEDFDKLFRPFSKVEQNFNESHEGSGLSLSISRQLAYLLGADLTVESEVNQYTRFTLVFPEKLVEKHKLSKNLAHSFDTQNKNTILVVDDDPTSLLLLSKIVETSSHAKVIQAKNGRDAIQKVQEINDLACVFMDLKMPDVDGYETTRQIKAINSELPVIAVTAYTFLGDHKLAMEAGCKGYVTKPYSISQIVSILKQLEIPMKN